MTFEIKEYTYEELLEIFENIKKMCLLAGGCRNCVYSTGEKRTHCPLADVFECPNNWELDKLYEAIREKQGGEK